MNRRLVAAVALVAGVGISHTCPPAAADPNVQQLQPSRPSTPALDAQFLADLTRTGIRIVDAPTAIAGAHELCAYLAAGHVTPDAVEQGQKNNPTMRPADEIVFVGAAVRAYCPRYVNQTDTLG